MFILLQRPPNPQLKVIEGVPSKKKKWEDPMQMAFVRVSPEISVN